MYGFRLYEWSICKGLAGYTDKKFEDLKLDPQNGSDALEHIFKVWEYLKNQDVLTGRPKFKGAENYEKCISHYSKVDGDKSSPRINIEEVTLDNDARITGKLEYGTIGMYKEALGKEVGDRKNIKEHATINSYRVLMLADDNGDKGFMVAEDIDRRCPARILERWITLGSYNLCSGADGMNSMRLKLVELADKDHLVNMITDKDNEISIKLTEKSAGSNPGRNSKSIASFEELISGSQRRDSFVKIVMKWLNGQESDGRGVAITRDPDKIEQNYTENLKRESSVHDSEMEFNDGYVRIKRGKEVTIIRPDLIGDVFNYVIGEERPTDDEFARQSFDVLEKLMTATKKEVAGVLS